MDRQTDGQMHKVATIFFPLWESIIKETFLL